MSKGYFLDLSNPGGRTNLYHSSVRNRQMQIGTCFNGGKIQKENISCSLFAVVGYDSSLVSHILDHMLKGIASLALTSLVCWPSISRIM